MLWLCGCVLVPPLLAPSLLRSGSLPALAVLLILTGHCPQSQMLLKTFQVLEEEAR